MHFGYLTLTMKSKAVSSRRSLFALLLVTMAIVVGGASVISEPRSAAMASVELVNGVEEMVCAGMCTVDTWITFSNNPRANSSFCVSSIHHFCSLIAFYCRLSIINRLEKRSTESRKVLLPWWSN